MSSLSVWFNCVLVCEAAALCAGWLGWLSCASHVWNKLVNCGSSHNRGEATGEMAGE